MDCLVQNFVVNISDVANKGDVVAALGQPATQNIEVNARANMADMGRRLNCCAAEINPYFALFNGGKWCDGSRSGVI